jgi:hypothetical protein
VTELWQKMRSLQAVGDRGSVVSMQLEVPAGCSLDILINEDKIVGHIGNDTVSFSAPDITRVVMSEEALTNGTAAFLQGRYDLRLVYGGLGNVTKPWSIVFE